MVERSGNRVRRCGLAAVRATGVAVGAYPRGGANDVHPVDFETGGVIVGGPLSAGRQHRQHPLVRALTRSAVLVVLACMIALSTLVSACTLAELHDHKCTGENCPTCLVLDMAQGMLSSAATPGSSAAAGWLSLAVGALVLAVGALILPAKTPVSNRVKLLI